jgi:hypothetical protein
MPAYETTTVATEKSQGAIRKLLLDFGAAEFQFGEGTSPDGSKWSGVSFTHGGHQVLMQVPMKPPDDAELRRQAAAARRAKTRTLAEIQRGYWEQEEKRIWRVLYWSIKARMIAVDEGVETMEQAFLAHLVDPRTGLTLWQHVQPALDRGAFQIGGAGIGSIGPGSG